jgi:TrmH family RNA methyltransferase
MGTLLRTAAWFNIKNIALSVDSADPFNNKVVRSAMGAHTYINIYQKIDVVPFIKKGYLLIGADQNGKSQLEDTEYTKKIMLCLGSEAEGFDKSFKNNLDRLISIKKIGQGESLNVAIAGSILMNEISIK